MQTLLALRLSCCRVLPSPKEESCSQGACRADHEGQLVPQLYPLGCDLPPQRLPEIWHKVHAVHLDLRGNSSNQLNHIQNLSSRRVGHRWRVR